jgi:TolB-like protein/class 3 adenylate cyclase
MEHQNRQLAAILFTDIVGYTAMMQKDEQQALAVTRHYTSALKQSTQTFHGKILNDYGDGSLCSFPSVTEAVKAAVQIQQQLQQEPKVPLRIGIHVGELFFEEDKVMGDSVNVASRIQSLGQANTILFSKEVSYKLKNQPEYKSISLGKFEFKNVDEPLEIFALANDGLIVPKREQLSGKLKEIKRVSVRRKSLNAAAGLLILLAAFFAYEKIFSSPGFAGEKSIAVLPFDNSGAVKMEEYVTDGITQDIIGNLSKISSLKKVIAWASVRSFRKTTKTIKEVANELGVGAMLTGTFEIRAGKIRVIAELTEAETGKRLWGEDFEYNTADISTIQNDVATKIANALRAEVTSQEQTGLSKHSTQNEEAYKDYIKGRYYWNLRAPGSYDSAELYFKKAIALDPEFALAYAGVADCYTLSAHLSSADALPVAKVYSAKALSLDSTLAEAWTTVGFIQSHREYDWSGGKKILEKAIRLSPNYSTAHLYYGNVLLFTGDINDGLNELKKALELDPLSSSNNWVLGHRYYLARKYDLAISQLRKTLILFPDNNGAKEGIGLSYLHKKMYKQAIAAFISISDSYPAGQKSALFGYAYALSGEDAKAERELTRMMASHANLDPYWFALVYTGLNKYDQALTQWERAYDLKSIYLVGLKIREDCDPLRNQPRFKALLKKLNFE